MMSEYFDHFHRWEPLAEFHFSIEDEETTDDNNYVYCLCSRAFIKDSIKTYYVEKEDGSESDVEVLRDSRRQEWQDQSHVHFSLDTSYKVKCENPTDENASCYCSASHTDNYYSTDEHDPAQNHCLSHALQPSDSGADLTYPDYHSDIHEKPEKMDQDSPIQTLLESPEDYLSEDTWEKFWAINGERLIWASWIKKYSDYINPGFLDDNNQLVIEDNNVPKEQQSINEIYNTILDNKEKAANDESMRERKFSYDSKVNPYKKRWSNQSSVEKNDIDNKYNKDDTFIPIRRQRSCSEHDRMVSPRTLAGTDSMTNVTKITLSSYDRTSSRVTSESSPTDDYSVSSSTSDDPSNDQTRIANLNDNVQMPLDEVDSEDYWQFLWKKHFGEQYALHYANYIECNQALSKEDIPTMNTEKITKNKAVTNIECETSEANSQDMVSVIEMQTMNTQVEDMTIDDKNDINTEQSLVKKKADKENIKNNSQAQPQEITELVTDNAKEATVHEVIYNQSGDENCKETVIYGKDLDADQPQNKLENVNEYNDNAQEIKNAEKDKEDTAQVQVEKEKGPKQRKRNRKHNPRYLGSVGFLLQNLLKEEENRQEAKEACDGEADNLQSTEPTNQDTVDGNMCNTSTPNAQQSESNSNFSSNSNNRDEDDPAEEKSINLKRRHEFDEDEESTERIKTTFEIMGFCLQSENMPKGQIVYRKLNKRLRPPRSKRFGASKKTYFDDDGNPYQTEGEETQEESDAMQTDDDCVEVRTDNDKSLNTTIDSSENNQETDNEKLNEASLMPLPDLDASFSDFQEDKPIEGVVGNIVKRRRRQKRYKVDNEGVDVSDMPPELAEDSKMRKYWKKRHSLFHRFDEGIQLDKESWFSVTPENVAWHIANKCIYDVVLDAFCGAGGNTIQFARTCKKVIAIDIDPAKVEMARHNATVYGVVDRIEFIVGDFFELAPNLSADMVFLSPPWGGPKYSENKHYDIESMLEPKPASELMRVARQINPNVALYLPRNTRSDQILSLAQEAGGSVEVEQSYLDKRFVAITAYFY